MLGDGERERLERSIVEPPAEPESTGAASDPGSGDANAKADAGSPPPPEPVEPGVVEGAETEPELPPVPVEAKPMAGPRETVARNARVKVTDKRKRGPREDAKEEKTALEILGDILTGWAAVVRRDPSFQEVLNQVPRPQRREMARRFAYLCLKSSDRRGS